MKKIITIVIVIAFAVNSAGQACPYALFSKKTVGGYALRPLSRRNELLNHGREAAIKQLRDSLGKEIAQINGDLIQGAKTEAHKIGEDLLSGNNARSRMLGRDISMRYSRAHHNALVKAAKMLSDQFEGICVAYSGSLAREEAALFSDIDTIVLCREGMDPQELSKFIEQFRDEILRRVGYENIKISVISGTIEKIIDSNNTNYHGRAKLENAVFVYGDKELFTELENGFRGRRTNETRPVSLQYFLRMEWARRMLYRQYPISDSADSLDTKEATGGLRHILLICDVSKLSGESLMGPYDIKSMLKTASGKGLISKSEEAFLIKALNLFLLVRDVAHSIQYDNGINANKAHVDVLETDLLDEVARKMGFEVRAGLLELYNGYAARVRDIRERVSMAIAEDCFSDKTEKERHLLHRILVDVNNVVTAGKQQNFNNYIAEYRTLRIKNPVIDFALARFTSDRTFLDKVEVDLESRVMHDLSERNGQLTEQTWLLVHAVIHNAHASQGILAKIYTELNPFGDRYKRLTRYAKSRILDQGVLKAEATKGTLALPVTKAIHVKILIAAAA